MKLASPLPLSALFFKHWGPDDREHGVVIAKAGFARAADGAFYADPTPPEIALEDRFAGDPATSALVAEQDLAPAKPATDLILHAVARPPGGVPRKDWAVSVEIAGRLHYGFHVRGPAEWQRSGGRWQMTQPAEVRQVPLDFALAYGGCLCDAEGKVTEAFDYNPAGRGFVTRAALDASRGPLAAPMIGTLADFMAADPLTQMEVHGTGPIAKGWLPRRALAGTFDAGWQRDRHPRMPLDYSLAFWNAAHRPLQIPPGLTPGEVIRIDGIAGTGPVALPLPPVALALEAEGEDAARQPLTLDTIAADLTEENPMRHRLTLTWRARVEAPDRFRSGRIVSRQPEPAEG